MSKDRLSNNDLIAYKAMLDAANQNRVASVEDIYRALYPDASETVDKEIMESLVWTVVGRLRRKLPPDEIVTRLGIGYFSETATRIE